MQSPEKVVKQASRLYEMRDAARLLLGPERYAEETDNLADVLQRIEKQRACNTLEAAIWLAGRLDRSDGFEVILIFAAAVELMEPSSADHVTGDQ